MKIKLLLLLLPLLVSMKVVIATPLTATITGQNNPLCNGGFGSATVTASGGTAPYTYSWAPAGGNGSTATGLTAGSYTVTVTDAASNTATATVTLTQPTQITAVSTSSADVSCFGGNNGDIYESVSGGTPPYTYLWSPSGNTSLMATGLSAGIYTLTITDNNGCTGTAVATITQPSQLVSTSAMVPNTTCVSPNGSASVTVTGGTPPYKYSWSPVAGTTYSITGLNAGTYVCTITDGNNCADTISVTVTGVVGPALTLTPIADTNVCNGAVIATVIGGTPPYTYLWTPGGQTTATITGLCDGNYCCTVTDANGCTDYSCAVVNTICNNSLAITNTPATCGNNGSATANASGGVPPYTYLWYPGGQTTATITGLSGGSYSVVVHDQSPCYDSGAVSVSSATVSYTVSGNPTSIITGDSTLLIASCNAAATFSWAPPLTVASPTSDSTYATPAVTTEYTVTITTACGSFTDSVLITVNCFNLTMTSTSSFCTSGTATAAPSGGTTPYTYLWAPGGQTTNSISSLSAGTYSVTVTDSSGCSVTDSVTIGNDSLMYSATASPATIIMGDSTYLSSTCTAPATYSWAPAANVTNPNSASSYAAPPVTTEYTVTITTACGTFTDSVLVTVNCFSVTTTSTSSYCSSLSGTSMATATLGIPPYTYLWTPGGETTASVSGLSAGIYTVTVTDSAGCSVTSSANIGSDSVVYSATGNPLYITAGDSTLLTATCNVSAVYSWAPSASVTNPTSSSTYAHPATNTVYTVTITTPCGTYTDTVDINIQCFPLAMSSTPSYYSCTSSYDGTATVTPSGGTPPYTYLWNPGGQTTATITGLTPGTYSVIVHDNTGCSATASVGVSSAAVSLTVSAFPATITMGDSSYLSSSIPVAATYLWAPATGLSCTTCANPMASPTVTTTYTLTATDTCGVLTDSVTVYVANCTNNFNEPICIVTVDTLNGKAMVIWGRTNSPPQGGYGSYIVYKENASSVFVPIENQPLNVLSEYIDTSATPSLAPVSYKLATDDSCGESALSAVNTTIYLTVTAGVNVNILNWTPYVGFAPSKYRIFRGPSLTSLVQIDSVPNTVLTYHDTLPPGGSLYVVEAVNPSSTCIPTASIRQHSASVHMLSGSFSNGSVKTETAVQPVSDENIHLNIFPNPSNGSITVQWSVVSGQSSVGCISVINELGQVVYSENKYMNSGSNSEQINLENLASGIYSLRMQTNNSITVKKLVVMRKS